MSDYTKATNFTSKDTLPTGNAGKIVKGTEIDTEFTAIASAISSKADSNNSILTGAPTAPTASAGTDTTQIATTAFVTAERTNTATLTNKTLTSPVITGGSINNTPIGATTPTTGKFTTAETTTAFKFPDGSLQTTASIGFNGATINAASSSAITLTSTSSQYQVVQITNAANNIVTLPDATTLLAKGSYPFVIENRSPIGANLTIKDNAGNPVAYVGNGITLISLLDNSTAAGVWQTGQTLFNYDGASITSNTVTPAGTPVYVGLSSTSFVRMWTIDNGQNTPTPSNVIYFQVATISGSTITFGAISSATTLVNWSPFAGFGSASTSVIIKPIRLSNTAFTVYFGYYGSGEYNCNPANIGGGKIFTCTVSGTTVTVGAQSAASIPTTSADISNVSAYYNGMPVRLSDISFAIVYNDSFNASYIAPKGYSGSLSCQVVTVSGTSQTIGTKASLGTSTYTVANSLTAMSSTLILVAYGQATSAGGTTGRNKMVTISVSGTTSTWNTPISIETADVGGIFSTQYFYPNMGVAPSSTQAIFNIGNGIAEGTISGTVPTYDVTPYASYSPIYLLTSSKALFTRAGYANIVTGGFVVSNTTSVWSAANNTIYGSVSPQSPLGAQPTTSFVGITSSTPAGQFTVLGNSL